MLRQGMLLIRRAEFRPMRKREQRLIAAMAKKHDSQGFPKQVVRLRGRVTVTLMLRVKSNATWWLRENAESLIRLRDWIKAGSEDELFHQTTYATPERFV